MHRIDKDTSGLLVVAKTDRAHHGLAAQFEAHKVERYYRAVVFGAPDANDPRLRGVKGVNFESGNIMRLTTQLARHKTDRQRQAVLFQGGRHAVTRARLVERFGTPIVAALVECWLETGRTHQIRVHMAATRHPCVGDLAYGADPVLAERLGLHRQWLHAVRLEIQQPITGELIILESPYPTDLAEALVRLAE